LGKERVSDIWHNLFKSFTGSAPVEHCMQGRTKRETAMEMKIIMIGDKEVFGEFVNEGKYYLRATPDSIILARLPFRLPTRVRGSCSAA
jgi:hypothetical protein